MSSTTEAGRGPPSIQSPLHREPSAGPTARGDRPVPAAKRGTAPVGSAARPVLPAIRTALGFLARLVAVTTGLVAVWWLAVLVFAPPVYILPGPDRVAAATVARAGDLARNAAVTGGEMLLGLFAGVGLGVASALLMARFGLARRLVLPALVVLQALPVFAVAPLLVLWFGFGLASKVVMATLIVFFPVASAFHDGLTRTDPGLLDLASLYRASRTETLVLIRLPAALPGLVSGLRLAAAAAPIGAVVGEWVGSSAGLGLMMLHANARLQTDVMFAALAVVALMAVALRLLVEEATRRLVPWLPESP